MRQQVAEAPFAPHFLPPGSPFIILFSETIPGFSSRNNRHFSCLAGYLLYDESIQCSAAWNKARLEWTAKAKPPQPPTSPRLRLLLCVDRGTFHSR
jgi:hypothetical protein